MINVADTERLWRETTAWWHDEVPAPLLQTFAGIPGRTPHGATWDWHEHPDDPEAALDGWERQFEATLYRGGAFPNCWMNWGAGSLAAYLTGWIDYRTGGQTAWFEQPRPWDDIDRLAMDADNPWRHRRDNALRAVIERAPGRFFVGLEDFGGIMDVAASLRGTQELLVDLVEEPERVHDLRARICDWWQGEYDAQCAELSAIQAGSAGWMGVWAPGTNYPLQCDFSAMISPAMFEEFVAPDLDRFARRLDYAVYHWDGPGQIPHLDQLLAIDGIKAIQWVPGSAQPQSEAEQWWPLYERIIAAGKRLILQQFDSAEGAVRLVASISRPGRLLLSTYHLDEAACIEFERAVARASRR